MGRIRLLYIAILTSATTWGSDAQQLESCVIHDQLTYPMSLFPDTNTLWDDVSRKGDSYSLWCTIKWSWGRRSVGYFMSCGKFIVDEDQRRDALLVHVSTCAYISDISTYSFRGPRRSRHFSRLSNSVVFYMQGFLVKYFRACYSILSRCISRAVPLIW